MPTPSIRLTENLRRAVRNSQYSIGDLAREGIEQAVISDFIGVCWVCGEAIHQQERHEWIDQYHYEQEIGEGTDSISRNSYSVDEYQQSKRYIQDEVDETGDVQRYHEAIKTWLALPDDPVEFCSDCTQYLKQAHNEQVLPTEIPVPYLYRQTRHNEPLPVDQYEDDRVVLIYATDSAAVWFADYISFQRRDNDGIYWWAARDRQQIKKYSLNIWLQIAKKSHAHRLGWGASPLPVFKSILEKMDPLEDWSPDGFDDRPPGVQKENLNNILEDIEAGNYCPACGLPTEYELTEYCQNCYYIPKQRSPSSADCEQLHLHIEGSLHPSNITIRCQESDQTKTLPEGYAENFVKEYQPIFEAMEHAIPLNIP